MQLTDLIRPDVAGMQAYQPIYPFEVLAARLGRTPAAIVKLDANENPYGPSPRVRAALAEMPFAHIYPDPESRALRAALAEFTGLPAERLLAGAGADELLDLTMRLFLQPGDAILDCPPTFGMYAFDAGVAGARVIQVPRRPDWSVDVEAVEAAARQHQPKLLFLASPNNPDGGWLPDADLRRLLELPLVVVLDEAYVEFAEAYPSDVSPPFGGSKPNSRPSYGGTTNVGLPNSRPPHGGTTNVGLPDSRPPHGGTTSVGLPDSRPPHAGATSVGLPNSRPPHGGTTNVSAGSERSRISWVLQHDNLIVPRTFSKWAGLAGLRAGYGAFPAALMPHLWKIKQPYNVSVAASTAALAALQDRAYLFQVVERIVAERERLRQALATIPYLQPYPSHANFILCRVEGREAQRLKLALEGEGILVRHFDKPRLRDHIRISVGTPEHTDALISALRRL